MSEMLKTLDTGFGASREESGRIPDLDMLDLAMVSGGAVDFYLQLDTIQGESDYRAAQNVSTPVKT